jgi:prolyl-tRNA synthetase
LQAGTSHFLGQNFAKAFDVRFSDRDNKLDHVWATSWGVSTRLIGGLVMAHSDDEGLIIPPRIAPIQVVIVPIYKGQEQKSRIDEKVAEFMLQFKKAGIRVKYDDSDNARPGWKFAEYEMKGVPVRIAIGMRDVDNQSAEVARRDTKEKTSVPFDTMVENIQSLLEEIQLNMFNKAKLHREAHTHKVDDWQRFEEILDGEGGFISAHWDGTAATEAAIKEKTKATIRCIPLDNVPEEGKCILTGGLSSQRVLFARAY